MGQVDKELIKYLASIITDDPDQILEAAAPAPAKPTTPTRPQTPGKPKTAPPWKAPNPKVNPGPKAKGSTAPARPAAPTKPKTPNKPKTAPPWQAPNPKVNPGPKARIQSLKEAWDPDVQRNVRDFYGGMRGGKHQFGKHPLYAMYGDELAQKQYGESEPQYQQHFGGTKGPVVRGAVQAFMAIEAVEGQHTQELEELAVELVSSYLKWPKELFKAYLNREPNYPGAGEENSPPMDFEPEEMNLSPEMKKEVNKRITLNMLTQGHALHAMDSMHHLVSNELNAIDPQLLDLYTKFSVGSRGHFYFTPIIQQLQAQAQRQYGKAGYTQLVPEDQLQAPEEAEDTLEVTDDDLPGAEDMEGDDSGSQVVIVAYGKNFPILIQELIKGAQELVAKWQFHDKSEEDQRKIQHLADNPADEPWYFLVGPQIWKYMLKVLPRDHDLMNVLQKIYMQSPDRLHAMMADLIESIHAQAPIDHIKEEIMELMNDIEEEYGDDVFDPSDFDALEDDDEDYS
jgi:hypothetical protein